MVKSLSLIASVEILDIYALVGPMDSFDYRHVAKVQGLPVEGGAKAGMYAFPIDAGVIPRERVWQLQLKLSSGAQGIATIEIHELSVVVETLGGVGHGSFPLATTTMVLTNTMDLSKSKAPEVPSSTRSELMHTARSTMRTTATATRGGMTASDFDTSLNMSRSTARAPTSNSRPAVTTVTSSSSSKLSRTTGDLPSSSSSSAMRRTSAAATNDLALRNTGGGGRGGGGSTALVSQTEGPGSALMQQETAAVASVLNAVCEKMVGVVSEKTKAYLAKAGKRTERRVLDKMAKLEERIEKFDHVLEHATVSSREIEQALLALDKDLSSPRTARTPRTPAAVAV